jgi:hypothetical protein
VIFDVFEVKSWFVTMYGWTIGMFRGSCDISSREREMELIYVCGPNPLESASEGQSVTNHSRFSAGKSTADLIDRGCDCASTPQIHITFLQADHLSVVSCLIQPTCSSRSICISNHFGCGNFRICALLDLLMTQHAT